MFYDIGVAWLFLNSFKQKLKKANQFNAIDMDIEAYKKYLHTVLMVKYKDDKKYENTISRMSQMQHFWKSTGLKISGEV